MMLAILACVAFLSRITFSAPITNRHTIEMAIAENPYFGKCVNSTMVCDDYNCEKCVNDMVSLATVPKFPDCDSLTYGCCRKWLFSIMCYDLDCSNCGLLNDAIDLTTKKTSYRNSW